MTYSLSVVPYPTRKTLDLDLRQDAVLGGDALAPSREWARGKEEAGTVGMGEGVIWGSIPPRLRSLGHLFTSCWHWRELLPAPGKVVLEAGIQRALQVAGSEAVPKAGFWSVLSNSRISRGPMIHLGK